MTNNGFLKRHGVVRSSIKKDLLQFALPGMTLFIIELQFCGRESLRGFWGTLWGLITHPATLLEFPVHGLIGLGLFVAGLSTMLVGQITLWRNYSGTVLIRKDHRLIAHGIYRFTRNPIYLGLIMGLLGLPVYAASLYGFLTALVLIPVILNRVRLEEELLGEEFQQAYQEYMKRTKRLIPFIY